MTDKIKTLLALAAEFPLRKRVDYDKNDDRLFCNQVLVAVKQAAPEIEKLAKLATPVCIGFPTIRLLRENLQHTFDNGLTLIAASDLENSRFDTVMLEPVPRPVTTPAPSQEDASTPSSEALSLPQVEPNSHIPGPTPNTADTAAESGHKSGNDGKPEAFAAKLTAARQAAAGRKKPSGKGPKGTPASSGDVLPPQPPQTTA